VSPQARPSTGASLVTLAALFVVTLALRPQVIGIGPLLPAIREDLDISHGVAGLLGTIPVLCMGLFAPFGPWLARRLGPSGAIAACIGAIALFGLLRGLAPSAALVLLLTFGLGVGIGISGPVLSMIVRLRAAGRPALATGAYASGIIVGSTIAALVAIPIAGPEGDWRRTFVAFAIAALFSLGAWLLFMRSEGPRPRADGEGLPRLPWRSPTAWALAGVFGLQSMVYYGVVSWLPNVYVERSWTESDAASLVALLHAVGLLGTIGVPLVADRWGSRRAQLAACGVGTLIGVLGILVLPEFAYLWASVIGLALGAIFPLVLTLPVDVADRAADVGAAAALMLFAGYAFSSLGPLLLGIARDLTGNFSASLWILVVFAVILVAACALLSPARLRRGVHRAPPFAPPA
jgi:CP family cyanate transporter-like MFS transporter